MDYINTETKKSKIIIINERIFESIIKDLFTFFCLFAMFFLNHKYTDGAWIIDFVIAVFSVISIGTRASKNREEMTLEETIKYLEKNKESV